MSDEFRPKLSLQELKEFLDYKYKLYNRPSFIETDPVSIPHRFNTAEDIEISGFLSATIAWGQRKSILKNASRLMDQMGNAPYQFIMDASDEAFTRASEFVHRTFNREDTLFFLKSLRYIYRSKGGLRTVFETAYKEHGDVKMSLASFREVFLASQPVSRTGKHVSDVTKGSSAKRLNMFLRWMVRSDRCGVDFGIWKNIPSSALYLPLDVHTGNVSRKLGLLQRKQNDWNAVEEITSQLRKFDSNDPVKYDFALFGLGVFEKF
ncbi:MAG TPA: TIGR02757 family protein [Bacteroidales bacterium]|nr:TIGR02757 family protein [Bacteroidales bacterium]